MLKPILPFARLLICLATLIGLSALTPDAGYATLSKIQDEDPEAAQLLAQTAVAAQNGGDYQLASQQWEKLIEDFPDATLIGKAHYNAGVCQVQLQAYDKAAGHFSTAIKKLDDDDTTQLSQAYLFLGFSQFRIGQALNRESTDAAQEEAKSLLTTSTQTFAKLLDRFPDFADADQACFFQGNAFEDLGRLEEAEASYTKMLGYPKQTFQFDGLFAIGNVNEQLGNYTKALEYYDDFRKAAEESGGNSLLDEVNFRTAKTLMRLAVADRARGDSETANQNYTAAAKYLRTVFENIANSNDEIYKSMADEARFQQAYCLTQLSKFEEAAEIYQSIADSENSSFKDQAQVYAGNSLARAGQTDQAEAALQKALEANSEFSIEAAAALSSLYLKQEKFAKSYALANDWIEKSESHRLLPTLMMDRADAVYKIESRRAEAPGLFLQLADTFVEHELAPAAIYNAAYAYLDLGELENAIETADRFIKSFPENDFLADTLEIKADAMLLDDNASDAVKVFEKLVSEFPDNTKTPRWILRKGLASYLLKDYQGTVDWLESNLASITQPQQVAEAYHWIGSSQFNLEENDAAAASLQKSLDADSDWRRSDETLLTLTRSLFNIDDNDLAKQAAQKLMEQYPESPLCGEAHYYVGEHEYEAKNFDDALNHFAAVIKDFPDSRLVPFSIYNAAWCNLEQQAFDESEKLFSTLINDFPDHQLVQKAKVGRGAARRKTGKMEESIADLKASLESAEEGAAKNNTLYELGLAQVEQKQWKEAVETFSRLLVDDADSDRADRYHYELAWAHNALNDSDQSLQHFRSIVDDFPDSDLAPESNFHVGTARYEKGEFNKAIAAYQKCVDSDAEDSIREKAAYKLAWAFYKQDEYEDAKKNFDIQTRQFPEGNLFADGVFMLAECQFRLKEHDQALKTYLVAKPAIEKSENIDPKIELLTMLHGSQSANKVRKFSEALQLATPATESDVDDSYKQDAWLQVGIAQEGLKNDEAALKAFRLAEKNFGKTGARATCMIGDLFFRQKKFEDAIREFKLVYYRFGKDAPDDIKPWQAYALYEAARCNYVQVAKATEPAKSELIREAIKHFENLVDDFGNDRLAPEAKKQLENLKKMQPTSTGT